MLLSQGNLRDKPLVDLTLPLLFVRGSKDSMCKAGILTAVKARMSSVDLQVRWCWHTQDSKQCQHLIFACQLWCVLLSSIMCKRRCIDGNFLQVHEVEGGDHGLAVHAGKQSKTNTQNALRQVSAAICEFACMLQQKHVAEQSTESSQQQDAPSHHKQTHAVTDSSSLDQGPPAKRSKLVM